jgi:hypothetical protein
LQNAYENIIPIFVRARAIVLKPVILILNFASNIDELVPSSMTSKQTLLVLILKVQSWQYLIP